VIAAIFNLIWDLQFVVAAVLSFSDLRFEICGCCCFQFFKFAI
jgi:hypothetical protein